MQVTRNIVHRTMMLQSLSKQAAWNLTQFSQSPSSAPSYFPESHWRSEISSLSKVILVLGKARSHRVPNLGCRVAESPGLLIFADCSPHMFNILRRSACCRPSRKWITFNRFSTIFEAFVPYFYLLCTHWVIPESLLNHPNSFHGRIFKLNTKFHADSLLYSLSHFEWQRPHSTCALSTESTAPTD